MITKFVLLVGFVSCLIYLWMFIYGTLEKRSFKYHIKRVLLSIAIGFILVLPLFLLNNISGV